MGNELPTTFTVKRDKYYFEPFGENWDAVLSRLTPNQCNFVGNEYGHLRHQINENYAEIDRLRAELERVKAEKEKVCEWQSDSDGIYHTSCGEEYCYECELNECPSTIYCQHCGKKIKEIPAAPEEGE